MGKWKTSYEAGRKYNKEWEKEFKWLTARGNACHCKVCNTEITSMKKSALVLHEKGAKHVKNCESVVKHGKPIQSYFGTSAEKIILKEFEIHYSVAIACHSSVRSVDHLAGVVKKYSRKTTLEKIQLHRTKCAKLISNVVAKSFCEELIEELKEVKFSLLIDESTDVSVSKLLCLCVKFYSFTENVLKTEFLALLQITSATGESIFKAITDFFAKINVDLANCIGFSSDGASNVCGAHNSVLSRLKNVSPGIIFIKCTCHSLALCAEHAFKQLPSNLDFMLAEVARWFKISTLRRKDFQDVFHAMNDEYVYPSQFITPSTTRWLVKGKCIFSILSQWHELTAYFSVINDKDKNYHARILKEMLADRRNFLYLTFVLPIIQDFEKVNAAFQATNANPVKVFEDLRQLHRSLLVRVYAGGSSESNVLPLEKTDFGVKFEQELKKAQLCREDVHIMKTRCQDFLIEANAQLEKRVNENLDIISSVNNFNPRECLSHFRKDLHDFPTHFFEFHKFDNDKVANQYRKLLLVNWKNEFDDKNIPDDPVAFWSGVRKYKDALNENCFEELAIVALSAYCLPVSNAVVERIFSHVTNVKSKVRNKLSTELLSAIIRVRSKLHFRETCCEDFVVTKKMLSLFNNSMYESSDGASTSSSAATPPTPSAQDDDYTNEDIFDDVIAVPF